MFTVSRTSLSYVMAVGLGLGYAPQAFAQTEVNVEPAQPAAQPAPTIVNNNIMPASDSGAARASAYVGIKLLGTGAAMFGISYAVTVITAAAITDVCNGGSSSLGCRDVQWPIYLPVIGPFIQMGYVSGNGSNTGKALLAVDGVVQGTGVALLIAGAVMTAQARRPARYSLAPYAGSGTFGLAGVGRF